MIKRPQLLLSVAIWACLSLAAQGREYGISGLRLDTIGPESPQVQQFLQDFERHLFANWSPYSRKRQGAINLIYTIDPQGRVDPAVTVPDGKIEDNFAVLDAILSEPSPGPVPGPPAKANPDGGEKKVKGRIEFYSKACGLTFGWANTSDCEGFFRSRPDLRGKVVLFHSLPLSILHCYPGAFTAAELHAPANMRAIGLDKLCSSKPYPKDKDYLFPRITPANLFKDGRVRALYQDWGNYFAANKTAGKAALLKQRAKMDKKYAALFEK